MKDFFISYNGKDKEWATWIAGMLEENGHETFIQEWDIRPGHNFIDKMNEATKECACTIAVLSQNYIDALYTHPEWQVAFCKDPRGLERRLIPVRIDDFKIQGLLGSIVYIDLVGHDEEEAKKVLLDGVSKNAPEREAPFPGRITPAKPKGEYPFPGSSINLAFNKLRIGDTSELVGREEAMEWLEKQLLEEDAKSTVALASLHGMGGMGKTFLAQAFVAKHTEKYTFIPVYLGDKKPFDAGIELLTKLGIPTEEIGNSPEKLRAVLGQFYMSTGNGVIILDDVRTEDTSLLIPGYAGWRVLLTTRDKGLAQTLCGSSSHVKALDVLSTTDALLLFKNILGDKYMPEQEEIYKEVSGKLSCRPYALRLAAGCMLHDEFDPSPKNFLKCLHEDESVKGEGATTMEDLGELIKHCLCQLKEKSLKAFTCLQYLAVCGDEGIEDKHFISWQAKREKVKEGAIKEELLCAHSLGILLIEKVINEFFKEKITITRIRLHTDTLNILKKDIPNDAPDSLMAYLKNKLVDRDEAEKPDRLLQVQIYSLMNAYRDNEEIVSNLYDTFFAHLYYTSNLQWAYELGEAELETTNPEENQDRYQGIIGNQALILQAWGRLEEAMNLHKKEEEICEKLGDLDGLQASYGNQALILQAWGRLEEAMDLQKKKEGICEKLGKLDSLSKSYSGQALILKAWGRLEEAMNLYKKEEEISEKLGDLDGLQRSHGNQALILKAWGRLEEAMNLHEKEEEICEKLGNLDGLSKSYSGQGLILKDWGRLEEALKLYKKEEEICEKVVDLDGLSRSYGNQALILQAWGRLEEAMNLLKKQEEICEKLNNPQGLSICRWNLGLLLRDIQRHDEAISMFESAIALEEKLKAPDLENDKKCLENYRKSLEK